MRLGLRAPTVLPALALVISLVGCRPAAGTQVGKVAPDFSLSALESGAESLSDYRGRTVVLNFFVTTSAPCRAEMPDLQAVHMDLRDRGLVVLAVNQGETREAVKALVQEFGLTFPILLDPDTETGRKYNVKALPTTLIIDRHGVIRQIESGGPLTRTALRRLLEGLIK